MKEKYLKRAISIGVIFSLIISLGGISFFPSQAKAYGSFTEDFSATTYKDNSNTTADWNTALEKLRLNGGWTGADGVTPGYDNVSNISAEYGTPQIVLDSNGRPNIVWTNTSDVFFSKWNGSSWTGLASSNYDNVSNNSNGSSFPQIVLDSNDRPNIVWRGFNSSTGNDDILFSKWNGSAWTKADGVTAGYDDINYGSGGSDYPQIVLDYNQRPNIVWLDYTPGNYDIFFSRWNGSSWTGLASSYIDNISHNSGWSLNPKISLDSSGRPNIVWEDNTPGNYDIFFSRWNGSAWTKANGATSGYDNLSNNSVDSEGPEIVLDSSVRPNIVWGYNEIFFSKWNGTSWTRADGVTSGYDNLSNTSGASYNPQIVLDTSGRPNIVWQDETTGYRDIFFSKWNGSAWTGADGATSGYDNLSNNSGDSEYPQIAIDSSGRPNIVWEDNTTGNYDIFFSKWNGSAWMRADGATSGYDNLSNNSGDSEHPEIVLDSSGRTNIVWEDMTPGNWAVFFSKWGGFGSPGQAQSLKINSDSPGDILEAVLTGTEKLNGQTINYYLSPDGGANWEAVSLGVGLFFFNLGNDLRWRAVLSTTDPSVTPEIDSLTIEYRLFGTAIPLGSITINSDDKYTKTTNVNLALVAPDLETAVRGMCLSNDESSWSSWESFTSTKTWTLTSGDGEKMVYVKYVYAVFPREGTFSDNIILDTQAPTGSILINSGETYTNNTNVTLTLSATDATSGVEQMMVSNDANFTGAAKVAYATTKSWTFTGAAGDKTVYAKFFDAAGNASAVASDSISYVTTKSIIRLAGDDRYLTAIEISKSGWPNGAAKVVLARGDMFPDALAGGTLAAKEGAPILLTTSGSLYQATSDEIKRLKATGAIILGGEGAVSPQVISDLKSKNAISEANITRYGGKDRYETGAILAKALNPPANKTAIIATGENYPDALASASLAAYQKMPIILIGKSSVPSGAQDALKALGINKTIIVGGEGVVDATAASWLDSNGYTSTRLAGDDRYGTAEKIAEYALANGLKAYVMTVATGENFPDALAAGPFAGANKSPIVLVRKDSIPNGIKSIITTNKDAIYIVYITGGTGVVSDEVKVDIGSIVGAE